MILFRRLPQNVLVIGEEVGGTDLRSLIEEVLCRVDEMVLPAPLEAMSKPLVLPEGDDRG